MSYPTYPDFWRGDVYFADLGKRKGSVQSGYRPVIIIQNNKGNQNGPTLVVVPVSSEIKKMWLPVHVLLTQESGMKERSMAMCEQITTIDKSQIGSYMCSLREYELSKINRAILISLGMQPIKNKVSYKQGPNEMVMTLCRAHLQPYFHDPDYIVRRVDRTLSLERCVCCDNLGYDYRITTIDRRKERMMQNE